MKRILIALLVCLPFMGTYAKGKVDSKYLTGAVPEVNGAVVFSKTLSVSGKTTEEMRLSIYNTIQDSLMAKSIDGIRSRIVSDGKSDAVVVAKVEEYMIFKKKPFSLDRTRFRYQISGEMNGNKVTLKVSQISYYYNEDMEGENGVTYKAEEWISDKEAVNKSGTKLYPRSGKFRIKTIDRVEKIFGLLEEALKTK